jgi:hypothetical protein
MAFEVGIGSVDDLDEQAGLQRLVERALERCHESVRQLVDEADRIGDQHARPAFGRKRAHRGVERRE